jgi:branched-chain amino acid transport system permease protein
MVMVIAGGMGSIYGAVIGAIGILIVEELIKHISFDTVLNLGFVEVPLKYNGQENWEFIFGPMLVLLVLFARGGMIGLATRESWDGMKAFAARRLRLGAKSATKPASKSGSAE